MRAPRDIVRVMRQIAIGGPEAAAAWRDLPADLDLDEVWDVGRPLYPAMGSRAMELAPDHPRAAILAGVWRYTWTHNQIDLRKLLEETADPNPLIQGRPATLFAYARTKGDMAFSAPPLPHNWVGPPDQTRAVTFQGRSLQVPAPAEHALERLWTHQFIDAAWAIEHEAMDWDAFCDLARSRGLLHRVTPGVMVLEELGGAALVPPGVIEQLSRPAPRAAQLLRRGLRYGQVTRS